jgi:heptosyltransferase-2
MSNPRPKILIIRFSSFGDIIQALTAVDHLAATLDGCEIHWATREDFAPIVRTHPRISQVWALKRKSGFAGLLGLARELSHQRFTHIYDAHSNLRSHLLSWWLRKQVFTGIHFIRRPKNRLLRFLLFHLRLKLLPTPFRGSQSFVWPLKKWDVTWNANLSQSLRLPVIKSEIKAQLRFDPKQTLVLAPSAAWEMKRWPLTHWQELIRQLPQQRFFVLGGPQDDFCADLTNVDPSRVQNLAGTLNWLESSKLIQDSRGVVSGDTGIMHLSDYLGRPTFALMGPTAFGFPSWPNSHTLEVNLPCRPCTKDGRGRCRLKEYQKCLVDIRPEVVASMIQQHLPM